MVPLLVVLSYESPGAQKNLLQVGARVPARDQEADYWTTVSVGGGEGGKPALPSC